MSLSLPPLNALKSFEAAARTGGYVAAAAELGVSPAAVSQQVRHLETYLAKVLFRRFNNRIVLTDAGQAVFAGTTPALEDISNFTARLMSGPSRTTLVVSVVPSLAECWFMPKFESFCASEPHVKIHMRVEDDPVDFARDEIDLRLSYGTTLYPDLKTFVLFQDEVLPLCAPSFLGCQPNQEIDWHRVAADDFVHTAWGPNFISNPSWADWLKVHSPARKLDESKGHRVSASRFAIDFARRGLGVALAQLQLASPDLEAGKLVVASPHKLSLGHSYAATFPHLKSRKTGLKQLVDWLVSDPQIPAPRR
jgi:LysR family transcriptional regulator, glycine cleavage system transcriptional activator